MNFIKKKPIVDMIDNYGDHISDQFQINSQQQFFYQNLYSERKTDRSAQSFFTHNVKLTKDQHDICEGNS